VLELWDLRNLKKVRDIDWDGPKATSMADGNAGMEEDGKADEEVDRNASPSGSPAKDQEPTETEGFTGGYQAPFIYSC
jgi:hypothetical protein